MNGIGTLRQLAGRIRQELEDVEYTVLRAVSGMEKAKQYHDDMYLDVVALNLHGFYSTIEKIFQKIATHVECRLPTGANWHKKLLEQMAKEFPEVRPATISENTRDKLDEYRGFRHVVRNVYTYRFDPKRVENLALASPEILNQLRNELLAFATFLEKISSDHEKNQ
ncbi:MAG: antitoxin [Thermodesulfobacteriota bacterium]